MSQLRGGLYALGLLAVVVARPLHAFITQAVLGHSPLNPKEVAVAPDGWNVVPITCQPSAPPEPSTAGMDAARRFRVAHFGRPLPADEIGRIITSPLNPKE